MKNFKTLKERVEATKSNSAKVRALIAKVVDEESFVEMGAFAFSSNNTFGDVIDGEGVVTGYGTIDGIPVYVYAENDEVLGGGFGKAQADKIVNVLDQAEKTGTPVVSILSSKGARLGEGVSLLDGYSRVMAKITSLKGIVPQLAVVAGDTFGGVSILAGMADVCYMLSGTKMATTGPMVLQAKEGSTESFDSLCGAETLEKNGVNFATIDESELREALQKTLDLILCPGEIGDEPNNGDVSLNSTMTAIDKINAISDEESVLELSSNYASNAVTALARMGGVTVGIVSVKGELCNDMTRKLADFIGFIDTYDIPLVTLIDSEGVVKSACQEKAGLIREISDLAMLISETTNAKISVVCGDAVGMAYSVLASKAIGFDYALAWENANISTLPAGTGAEIVYADEIAAQTDKDAARKAAIKKYNDNEGSIYAAARTGFVDNIIESALTRPYILSALTMLENKQADTYFPL